MVKTLRSKVTAILAVIALSLSVSLVSPAEATTRPTRQDTSSTAIETVWVTQKAPGSVFGQLRWVQLPGATEYRIYNAGSFRPSWKLIFIMSSRASKRTIVDLPGTISIYRIMALINSKEVEVGRYIYKPTK